LIPWLRPADAFPPPEHALREPDGLLAAGGDLSATRLLDAYHQGIFPWFSEDQPILWWSPDPRMVLLPDALRVTRSLAKTLRNRDHELSSDTDFRAVMEACAAPRPGSDGTWITPQMVDAYCALHRAGWAHSVEVRIGGVLAGGLYGVAIGRVFFGESMFSRVRDASKMAFVHLVRTLHDAGFGLIDCQMATAHLASFGATAVPRSEFLARLASLIHSTDRRPALWPSFGRHHGTP
jgi:leucyl/phenylalanyl-tRNA--protein transferase